MDMQFPAIVVQSEGTIRKEELLMKFLSASIYPPIHRAKDHYV